MGIEGLRALDEKNISVAVKLEKKLQHIKTFYMDFNSNVYSAVALVEDAMNSILYEIILGKKEFSEYVKNKATSIHFTLKKYKDVNDFKKFRNENIQDIVVDVVVDITKDILINSCNFEEVEYVYIAFDGIPQMGKVFEQRKRRYLRYIESGLKQKIFNEYKHTLPQERIIFEENRLHLDEITSDETFMKNIYNKIKELKFDHVKEFVISGIDEYGEGEKKIFDDFVKRNIDENCVISSPDGDLFILELLLMSKIKMKSKMYIIVYKNKEEFLYTDIRNVHQSIIEYIDFSKDNEVEIINDVIFLFTLFGNDFIPKIDYMSIKRDFVSIILRVYKTYLEDKNDYIIKDGTKINYNSLRKIFERYLRIEEELLQENYLKSVYKNYEFLKRSMKVNFIIPYIDEYVRRLNDIIENIKNNTIEKVWNLYDNDTSDNKHFIIAFNNIEGENGEKEYDYELFKKIIHIHLEKYKKTKNIELKFGLKKKTDKINNRDIDAIVATMNIPIESLKKNKRMITEYDKELFKFDTKRGKYRVMLNVNVSEVGKVELDIVDDRYQIMKDDIPEDLDSIFYKNRLGRYKNIKMCIHEYIRGLFWVFNYYFNKCDGVPVWFFMCNEAPSIKGISAFLKRKTNEELNEIMESTFSGKNVVSLDLYISVEEHKAYILPYQIWNEYINEYFNKIGVKILEHTDIFPNLDPIIDDIYSIREKRIDCKDIRFLRKCIFPSIKIIDYESYMDCVR